MGHAQRIQRHIKDVQSIAYSYKRPTEIFYILNTTVGKYNFKLLKLKIVHFW